ncbi:MAG: hypothetical protein V2I33_16145 [Kangiellaceae bacterium]|nr:hypothetical protein [Kangiellaceae bacterium]
MEVSLESIDPKHWVVTRCGKVVLIEDHSVRDFKWEFVDYDDPLVQERCRMFQIDPSSFTVNHPKIENVDDAIAQQIPYFYWTKPNELTYSILNVAANESNMIFLKSSDLDILIGDENWTTIAKEHPARISFDKRLDMFRAQSEKITDTLYMMGEDNGWLILLRMKGNLFSDSIRVDGMIFHSDPQLQLNTQQNWERHGNKTLYLAFTRRNTTPHMQDSVWTNVGWPNSSQCLRSHLRISADLVNDSKIKAPRHG